MADPFIRPMVPADIPGAMAVFASVAREGVWLGTQPGFDETARRATWAEGLADPARRSLLVVEPGTGRILGNGSIVVAPYGVAELGMALAQAHRGRGLGRRLLDALIEAARDLGAHKVDLQVWPHNEPALRLYLSRGFVVEGRVRAHYRRVDGRRWDAILMGLSLDPVDDSPRPPGSGLDDAPVLPATIPIRDP